MDRRAHQAGVAFAFFAALASPLFAHADETTVALAAERTALWPWTLSLALGVGAEPHAKATPIAYGFSAEALWRGRVGPFLSLFAASGTMLVPTLNAMTGKPNPALPDRISIPFGLAARPFARAAELNLTGYGARVVEGIGLQIGVTVEHYRTSDRSATTAGLHLQLALELPLVRGPLEGNALSLRAAGRLMATPPITFYVVEGDDTSDARHQEPVASGQLLFSLCYYP